MKKIFVIILAIASLGMVFTSCKKDGEMNASEIKNMPEGLSEDGDCIYYKTSYNGDYGFGYDLGYDALYTWRFEGGYCVKATLDYIFDSDALADAFYAGMQSSEYPVSRNGKVITIDVTETYRGKSREEIRAGLNSLPEF